MSELELKFHVEPRQRAALLKALGNRKLEQVALSARYFDTADQLLARHGMALRLRREDGRWVQTLKGVKPGALERFEDEVTVDACGDGEGGAPRPDRHRRSPVGRRLLALLRRHDRPALVEAWRTDVTRLRRRLRAHGADIEWALDEGATSAGGRTHAVSELELEFKDGDVLGLYATARDWQARHGLWVDAVSKAERGALLLRDQAFGAAAKAEPPAWRARAAAAMSGSEMLRRMAAASLQQILANASEIARGSGDAEHVHQLRVGLRRLRTAARAMQPFSHALPAGWEDGVMPLFDALGQARDRHVFATTLAPRLRRAGAPAIPQDVAPQDDELVGRLVRGAAFQQALLSLLAFAFAHAGGDGADGIDAARHVRGTLRRLWRRVLRDADRFDELPFERQHRVRKRLKRLRYLAEFVSPWFDARRVEAWLKRVERAQDAMGRHVDQCQAAERLAREAGSRATAWFAAEWLRSQARKSARDSRRALRRMARATPFWKSRAGR
jgi:inorganic triphosphatase YgiF